MDDLISRKKAIDACMKYNGYGSVWACIMGDIKKLPSVTIKDTADKIKVTNCNDNISRQAICDALDIVFADRIKSAGFDSYETADRDTQLVCDGIMKAIDVVLDQPTVDHIADSKKAASSCDHENGKDIIYRQDAIEAIDDIETEVADGFGFQYEKWRKHFADLPSAQPEIIACGQGELVQDSLRLVQDCIDRQAAIDALDCINGAEEVLKSLPSVQLKRTEERTETHACENTCEIERKSNDMISRQAVLEICDRRTIRSALQVGREVMKLPSAQPEPNCSEIPNNSDTISRADVIDVINNRVGYLEVLSGDIYILRDETIEKLKDLPPAQPTYTDAEIQKMQDLEQAQIEKAYELGYEEGKKDGRQERTGNWVEIGDEPYDEWECDKCGFVIDGSGCIDPEEYRDIYIFCPHCGSMMLKEGEEHD